MKNAIIKALVNAGGTLKYQQIVSSVMRENFFYGDAEFLKIFNHFLDTGEILNVTGCYYSLSDTCQPDKYVSRETPLNEQAYALKNVSRETLPQYQHMTLEKALEIAKECKEKRVCISEIKEALIFLADSLEIIRNQAIIDHITKG